MLEPELFMSADVRAGYLTRHATRGDLGHSMLTEHITPASELIRPRAIYMEYGPCISIRLYVYARRGRQLERLAPACVCARAAQRPRLLLRRTTLLAGCWHLAEMGNAAAQRRRCRDGCRLWVPQALHLALHLALRLHLSFCGGPPPAQLAATQAGKGEMSGGEDEMHCRAACPNCCNPACVRALPLRLPRPSLPLPTTGRRG